MPRLPGRLALVDARFERVGSLERLGPRAAFGGRVLRERDYDALIVKNADLLVESLKVADVIEDDSQLRYLGKILNIDVLFAEEEAETNTFRRFVIAEDKLFRNPEGRREVLGQVLAYQQDLASIDFSQLSELLSPEHRVWLDANEDLITEALRDGQFLLLVCGDDIRPRLIDYLDHLKDQLNPTSAAELALVSLAVFTDGKQHVLVPHVVGSLVRPERSLLIRVVVSDKSGDAVPHSVTVERAVAPPSGGRERIEYKELIAAIEKKGGAEAVQIAEALFKDSEALGAEVKLASTAASVRVRNLTTRRYCTLFVVTKNATFYIGWNKSWHTHAGVDASVARNYQDSLTKVLGRDPKVRGGDLGGAQAVPLTEVGRQQDAVVDLIRGAISALRGSHSA